ncbi:MAG: DoxX family protein [Nitrospira sp.]|nr:DoxX family protein [Nitrospira sp.]
MDFKRYEPYESLVLRIFLGLTLIFWGYEKLMVTKLAEIYPKDYGPFMFVDVRTFLTFFGIMQPLLGVAMILGLYTRLSAALLSLMAIITIIVPGMIITHDVPHFAYAFATAGGALALLIKGGGAYSLDDKWSHK